MSVALKAASLNSPNHLEIKHCNLLKGGGGTEVTTIVVLSSIGCKLKSTWELFKNLM